jgi:hypothetical protein
MKKFLLTILILFSIGNLSFSQNGYNWITPNKVYLKVYVAQDGMYRIDRSDFTNAGINTSLVDPRTVRLFNKGVEVPIYFSGQQDGTFDSGDFFDFYGSRNTGGLTKVYDQFNNVSYYVNEYYNPYSDTNIYWVDWGVSNGIRYADQSYNTTSSYPSSAFTDIVHLERDYYYTQGENFSSSDLRFLTTEKYRAEGWMWSNLSNGATLSETFALPMLSSSPQNATFRVLCYPTARNTSVFNEHTIELRVNNNLVATIQANDANRFDTTMTFSSSLLTTGTNTVSIRYSHVSGFTSALHADLMEIGYPRRFGFTGSTFDATLNGTDTTSMLFSIPGGNNASLVNIYDVKNFKRIISSAFSLDTLKFTANANAKLSVVNSNITLKPLRIKQRSVPDLVSSANGADYLIIYNSMFESQAEQLRAYRQSRDNFRSFKAEVEAIYDIFNYGFEDPLALRNFTKHVYDNWQLPKLGYICLFGRGSLDPKKNLSTSSFYKNLVPVYGYPPSDGYYANFNIGTFCYYNQVPIGRLPVYSTSEAQTVVDKIISYEAQSPNEWSKNYAYVTGGGTLSEQLTHQSKSNIDILSLITPPTLSGNPVRIYRTDSSGYVSYNVKDSLRRSIDRGTAFINYRGHAGSHDWEIAMTDPNTLNNGTKLPYILSLTCFTGESSLGNLRGFGEEFTYLPNKGSIGFVGTTGWSYAQNGNDLGTFITTSIRNDTTRRIGKTTQYAHKLMSRDSISFAARHTLNCYTLLGDPAAELKIPKQPEFSVTNNDYTLSNSFPTVGENVTLTVFMKNFGLHADSAKIRFLLKRNNINYRTFDTVAKVIGLGDTVSYTFPVDSLGNYDIVVNLDQDNWFPQEDKTNNSITVILPVKNNSYVPLKPVTHSIIQPDSVTFTGLNPRVSNSGNSLRVILQVDTTSSFNSPVLRTFTTTNLTGVSTSFNSIVPVRSNNTLHYWRTNTVVNGDSIGWSTVQYFTYLSGALTSGSKVNGDDQISQTVNILKSKNAQFPQSDIVNGVYSGNGIILQDVPASLFVRSYGSNAEEASYFSIGDKNIYIDGGKNAGLNVVKVKKLTGSVLEFKNLKMTSTASSDSLVTFLNTFDTTHYMMLLNAAYVAGGQYLNTNAKTKLRQFGSIYCDSIGLLSYFHTWSMIGWLGAAHSQISEMFDPCCRPAPGCVSCTEWVESISSLNVNFRKTTATVNNIVGPAVQWNNLSWTQTLAANSSIKFDVYGIDPVNSQQYLLFSDISSNSFVDLSYVNAIRYPRLNLVAKLSVDTVLGNLSPKLNSISVNYIPTAELAWDINDLTLQSTYKVGDELKFTTRLYNVGYADAPGLIVNVFKKSASAGNLIYSDTSMSMLASGSSSMITRKFTVPYFRDSMNAIVQMKIYDKYNEFHMYNNDIVISMKSTRLYRPASIQVYSDGNLLNSGDYVRKDPELKVVSDREVTDNSLMPDTMRVSLMLNGKYIPFFNGGLRNGAVLSSTKDSPEQKNSNAGGYFFYPKLVQGKHQLTVIVRGDEESADTAVFDVIVSDDFAIKELYNYPNPMKGETNFMFTIAGSVQPESVRIRIYSVGGRLIREIIAPASIGSNSIPWDGRDSDGDYVANGTYLYKLITSDGSESEAIPEKLVILR